MDIYVIRYIRLVSLLLSAALGPLSHAQDRLPHTNAVFPRRACYHTGQGGRILDVTKPPFNADPRPSTLDNEHDDTESLVKTFDFIAETQRKWPLQTHTVNNIKMKRPARTGQSYRNDNYIIYFSEGVYDVSDTLTYNGDEPDINGQKGMVNLRVWGQSRERSIIQAANYGDARNLLIRSEDGRGDVGLSLSVSCVQSCIHDPTVDGFDRGNVGSSPRGVNPVLEHITLRNQRIVVNRPHS